MIPFLVVGETLVEEERQVTSKSICLVIPPSPWLISDSDIPALGPLYLSSYLKEHGFDVTMTDLTGEKLSDWWPKEHFDVWGITGSSANFPQMKIIAGRIKTIGPKELIVAGGAHATMAPEHLLNNSTIDIAFMGPGEKSLENFLKSGIPTEGMVFRTQMGFKVLGKGCEDYIMSPVPDYEAIDFKKYLPSKTFKYLLGEVNEATVLTTLGCPYRCNFCGQHNMRNKIKFIPLRDVEKNIIYLRDKYDVKLFYIMDDTFGFDSARFVDFCILFKTLGIHWHCLLRADMATEDRLMTMKDSGCLGIVYGFESGSDTILKAMNKKVTAGQNYRAAELTHNAGLIIRGQMVVGFPGETEKTIEETKRFIEKAPVDIWGIHTFQPYPGSDVWNYPEKYGIKIDKETDFSDWHTIGKPDEVCGSDEIRKWISELKEVAGSKEIGGRT